MKSRSLITLGLLLTAVAAGSPARPVFAGPAEAGAVPTAPSAPQPSSPPSSPASSSQPKPDASPKGRAAAKGASPLELRLLAGRSTYVLPEDGKALRKRIEEARRADKPLDPLPVDLTLEITNRASHEVALFSDGDDRVEIRLALKGPGVVVMAPHLMSTMEVRVVEPKRLEPGQSYRIPLTRLAYGRRGEEAQAYWTAPGRYTLTASLKTAIKPPLPGAQPIEEGFAPLTLTSNPVTLTVTTAAAAPAAVAPAATAPAAAAAPSSPTTAARPR